MEGRRPVYIVRQEHFERDFSLFLERSRLNVKFRDLRVAKDRKRAHSFDYEEVPALTDLAKSNLELWYARDMELYGACKEWIEAESN